MPIESIVKVDSCVPFATSLYWWLRIHDLDLDRLANISRRYEHPYLAWESVRIKRNPYFETGTGFEGYLIGLCQTPEEALTQLLSISREMLASIARLYRYSGQFQSRLMKTLTGEMADPRAIEIWAAQLGAAAARLRCNVYCSPQAMAFQAETYRRVRRLPMIQYAEDDQVIRQEYAIASSPLDGRRKIQVALDALKPADQDAGLVAWSIGRFGHPLVRTYLRQQVG